MPKPQKLQPGSKGNSTYTYAYHYPSHLLTLFAPPFGQNESNKPNIILFLVDDMGLMDTSVPMLADKDGKPQNIPLITFTEPQTWSVWLSRV